MMFCTRSAEVTEQLFIKYRPTYVLHLAAVVGGIFANATYPVDFFTKNITMNNNVLRSSHLHGVKKTISCLSTCIFPADARFPVSENSLHAGPPYASHQAYAYAKRMVDVANRAYFEQYGNLFTSVIPTNIYGPHDNFHLQNSHVIPGLIHKFYLAKQQGTAVTVAGTGIALRQFIYSRDLAKLLLWALEHYDDVDPIILCGDPQDEVPIRTVVHQVARAMNFTNPIHFDASLPDGQYKKTASNAKLRSLLPNFTFTSLEHGISHTVAWFVQNYSTSRH
uniref:GDP-L-fucose synthase n=1 Tax=Lygus hesperus TaxID=30085 RepID=A0A0A9YSW8_LYGHE